MPTLSTTRLVGLLVFAAIQSETSAAEILLHCPFDGDVTAAHAAGPDFAVAREENYVAGKYGQALQIGKDAAGVVYVASNNLDKARGSIALWIRPEWSQDDMVRRYFIWEEGPGDVGTNCIWLWKYGKHLRFDVRDPEDKYVTASMADWQPGQWHHLVATWDCEKGLSLFVDGKLRGNRETTWKPQNHSRFLVGSRQPEGDSSALASLDELVVYSKPLTPEEVTLAHADKLQHVLAPRKPLPKVASTSPSSAPKLIFHLPLNSDAKAVVAGGSPEPLQEKGLTYESGLFGQAAHFTSGSRLRFAAEGNLTKEQGTISLWFRPDFSGQQTNHERGGEIWRTLFREGPMPDKRIGSNQLWLWFFGSRMRFDVADLGDQYARTSIAPWKAHQWHHLACTWNHQTGRTLYVDGQAVSGGSDSRKPFLSMSWDTAPFEYFQIGGDDQRHPADGLIEDLRIFDGQLTSQQIHREFSRVYPISPTASHVYYAVGRPGRLRWQLEHNVAERTRGTLRWWVENPDGEPAVDVHEANLELDADTSERSFEIPFTPDSAGTYRLVCRWVPSVTGVTYERSLDLWGIDVNRTPSGTDQMELELVEEIDCTKDLPPEQLVESAPTTVVRTAWGSYREATAARNSRFALRISLPEADCPYVVEWEYPDDKPRTMEMISQTVPAAASEYELQTGVFTGAEYPLSNRMKTHRCLYWPRKPEVALIFMTAEKDRPAAAARVRVFRVRGEVEQAAKPDRPAPTSGWHRHVGIYYEDPALCYDFGNQDSMPGFETLIDRLISYMHYSGQDLFMYPGVWYHGPFYPSPSQGTVMQRRHPRNFIEYLLLRFETEGIGFLPTINLHSLPSLAHYKWRNEMIVTGEAAAGPLSVGWDGSPNLNGWHGTRPNYNIMHPEVQNAVLTMVDEMLDLYGDAPAFEGICFHLTKHCMLWFGEMEAGYNDYCVEAFQQDAGVRIPVANDDPGRATKRYRWIMANAREKWIDWRCHAIRQFYGEVAHRLAKKRPDLRLVLAMYRPVFRDVVPQPGSVPPGDFVRQINREGGLDPTLYADLPNVVLDRTIYPADYRWYRAHRSPNNDPTAIRDLLTKRQTYDSWTADGKAWVNMHDRYWEDSIGRRGWESFWGREHGWRVSTLNPTGPYALESYLIPLAHADIMTFTKGGFLIGTHGMEQPLATFSRAFRSLPAEPFETLQNVPPPLVARTLAHDHTRYLYVVNPSQEAANLMLPLGEEKMAVRDLGTGTNVSPGKELNVRMAPMSFKAYRIDKK